MSTKKGVPIKTYLRLRRAMKGTPPITGIRRIGGRLTKEKPKPKKTGKAEEFEDALKEAVRRDEG